MVQVQMSAGRKTRSKTDQLSPIEFPTIVSCSNILEPLSFINSSTTTATSTTTAKSNSAADAKKVVETPSSTESSWLWNCNVCSEKFSEHVELKNHMMEHAIDVPFECRLCSSHFKTGSALAKHIKVRHFSDSLTQKHFAETEIKEEFPKQTLSAENSEKTTTKKKKRLKSTEKSLSIEEAETYNCTNDYDSPASLVNKSHKPAKRKTKASPLSRKQLFYESELSSIPNNTHCFRCKIDFPTFEDWRYHAVYSHAIIKSPCPIVEMNYVDVQTIMKATQASVISTIRQTEGGQIGEKIRLTFCREKGSYVLKKSISTDESDSPPVLQPEEPNVHTHMNGIVPHEENITDEFTTTAERQSPDYLNLKNRFVGKDNSSGGVGVIRNRQPPPLERTPATGVSESVSPSLNKENMPSDMQPSNGVGDKLSWQVQKSVHEGTKSPTSGAYTFLGNNSSESERALANTGNSHVVIIQNDILHIGADADISDLQRLTAATTTNVSSVNIPSTITPKSRIHDIFPDPRKKQINSAECILPNFIDEVEHTVMISEEIRNRPVQHSQISNLIPATSLNGGSERTSNVRDGNTIEIHSVTMSVEEAGVAESAPFPNESKEGSAEGTRMSPAQTKNVVLSTQYETISPPQERADSDNELTDDDHALRIHLPEETEITEVCNDSSTERSCSNSNTNASTINLSTNLDRIGGREKESETSVGANRPTAPVIDDETRCQICHEVFNSVDVLDEHFRESHFRVGTSSNILEPESPFPATPSVTISDARNIFQRRSLDEQHSSGPLFPHRIIDHHRSPELDSARQLIHDHRLPPMPLVENSHFQGRSAISYLPIRPGVPVHLQQQMQGHGGRPMSNGPHNISMSANAIHHLVSPPGSSRPPLSSAPSNYAITQSLNTRPLNSMAQTPSSPQLTIVHQNSTTNTHTNHAHQQHLIRMNQQNQIIAQAHAQAEAILQQQRHYQQQQAQIQVNNAGPTSLQNALNSPRPLPVSGIRHNSIERDVPQIVNVTSIGRPQFSPQQQLQQQLRQQQQQQIINHQQQQQMQLRLSGHQGRVGSGQTQQEMQQQFRISNVRGGINMHAIRQELGEKRNISPLSNMLDNNSSAPKQPRLDALSHVNSHPNPAYNRGTNTSNTISDLTITQTISPQSQNSSAIGLQLPLDRNVVNAIGSVNSGGVNSVRLGTAITLSVCPTSDPLSTQPTNLSPVSRNASTNSSPLNTSSVASALAVRGVTVTPASPPVSNQESASQRYPVNVSISPHPDTSRVSPISVIQRVERGQHPSVNPTGTYYPPMGHNFVVPRNPAPRAPSAPAIVSHITDRPERPPTVDLTDEDSMVSMMSTPASRQGQLSVGRPNSVERRAPGPPSGLNPSSQQQPPGNRPTRSAIACNVCGVLFASNQTLEEHKFSRHGISQQRNGIPPALQIRPVSTGSGIRPPPPQLQQMRPISPGITRAANPSAANTSYLYIPLLDITRLDPSKLRRLEEIGITSVVPLHGNERAAGQMGIPVMSLRSDGLTQHMPWDSVLPVGPVRVAAQMAAAAAAATNHNHNSDHRNQENGNS